MAWVSLGLSALFGLLGIGVRTWVHRRRTGRSPIRHGAGMNGGMALGALALAFVAGPIAALAFGAKRLVHSDWSAGLGLALSVVGLAALLWSQSSMGDSLRIGVDPRERTALVTTGPFRWVRNPIYSAMLLYVAGVALLVPNAGGFVAVAALALALDLHVRLVEEPYLAASHGSSYASYASRVGRFVPGIGKFSPASRAPSVSPD
jgi:protein-S-isoprenylcysteine O-methyltransferase Ste14